MVLMVTGLIIMFGIIVLTQFGSLDVVESGSDAEGAYNDTLDSMTGFSEWLPIVGIVIVGGLIIYIIVRSFPQVR